MKYYGTIKFSTVEAPKPIEGICENFTYRRADTVSEVMGEDDLAAVVIHAAKGELSFSSTPEGDVTALGVRAGAELTISGISGGKIIVSSISARWQRGQAMTMNAQAVHYPDLGTSTGSITTASIGLSRVAGPLQLPADKVWWGVEGIASPVAGIVQSLSITESAQLQEEEDGTGDIVAVAVYGYKATASLEVLTSAEPPVMGTELDAFGSFRVTGTEIRWQKQLMRSITIDGLIIPGVVNEQE